MNNELLQQLIGLAITVMGIALTYFVIPWLKENTTEKQRQNAIYWTGIACRVAEQLPVFQESGLGESKKEFVISYLRDVGVKLTEDELEKLIDSVVSTFNSAGWDVLF